MTHRHRRSSHSSFLDQVHRRPLRSVMAAVAASSLVVGATVAVVSTMAGAATVTSQAKGEFLSASILGAPLDPVLNLQPAVAQNSGGPTVTDVAPINATVLSAINVQLVAQLGLLPGTQLLSLGVVNQVAIANPDGSSLGASGLVTDAGAINVNGSTTPGAPGTASINVTPLLTGTALGLLADLNVNVGALSAVATEAANAGVQTGDYNIAGLNLAFTSVALGATVTSLVSDVVALQPLVNTLPALIQAIPAVGALAVVGGVPNLTTITDTLTSVTAAGGAITANLRTGAITVDVAALLTFLGLDINNLPVGQELISYVTSALTTELLPAVVAALNGLVTAITNAVNSISVTVLGVPIALAVLAPVLNPVIAAVTAPINTVIANVGANVVAPLVQVVTDVLSIKANNQETSAGTFTETALRVTLLPITNPDTLVLNLAAGSVGPNASPAALTLTLNGPFAGATTTPVVPALSVGETANYTVHVANTGGTDTTSPTTIVTYLPPGLSFVSTTGPNAITCAVDATTAFVGQRLLCTVPAGIPAGGAVDATINVTADSVPAGGTVTTYAAVTPTGFGEPSDTVQGDCAAAPSCDIAGPTTITQPSPNFTQTKSADLASYYPGQAITYTITVNNTGTLAGTATVTDTIPAGVSGVTVATVTCAAGGAGTGTCGTVTIPAGVVTVPVSIPAAQTVVITITGTVRADAVTGQLANTATITPTGPACTTPGVTCGGGDTGPLNPPVTPVPVFTQTKVAGAASYLPGQAITYTVTIGNTGSASGTASVTDAIPVGVVSPTALCTAVPALGQCVVSVTGSALTGTVTVPAGGSVTIVVSGTVATTVTAAQLVNTAQIVPTSPGCAVAGVNCGGGPAGPAAPGVTPIPLITQTMTSDLPAYLPGQAITYTITVVNTGGTAASASVSDLLPVGLVNPAGSCVAPATCAVAITPTGVLTTAITVPPAASVVIKITGTVSPTAVNGDLDNLATVSVTNPDCAVAGVNCGGGATNKVTPAILAIPLFSQTKTADRPYYLAGQAIVYTVTVTNSGGATGTATVADVLPSGILAAVPACAPLGVGELCSASIAAGTLSAQVTVPAGQSVEITVSGTVSASARQGDLYNVALITPTGPSCTTPGVTCGGGPTNPVNPGAGPVAGISVTLTVSPSAPGAGLPVTYTATTGNSGPSTATGVVVTLPVPAAVLNPVGAPAAGGACVTRATTAADIARLDQASGPYTMASYPRTVVCTYPDLAPGASVVTSVTGTLDTGTPAGTVLVAQVVSTSELFDPDLSDNRAVARSAGTVRPSGLVFTPGPATPPSPLAYTGVQAQDQLWLVLVLLALGSLLLAAGLRRRGAGLS